jgi:biotin synthase-related radical SAM superfamily protein
MFFKSKIYIFLLLHHKSYATNTAECPLSGASVAALSLNVVLRISSDALSLNVVLRISSAALSLNVLLRISCAALSLNVVLRISSAC